MMTGRLLFPKHILHAMNALQQLRALHIMSDSSDGAIYSTCEEIAEEILAPKDSLWRTFMVLTREGIIESQKGSGGGYYITPKSLTKHKVLDVLSALGKEIPDNGLVRASDRLNTLVSDCLDVTLEEFFK